jgi:hypothetical protein
MTDLLSIWDIKLVKECNTIELHYSPINFNIDVDYKHGMIQLTKRKKRHLSTFADDKQKQHNSSSKKNCYNCKCEYFDKEYTQNCKAPYNDITECRNFKPSPS